MKECVNCEYGIGGGSDVWCGHNPRGKETYMPTKDTDCPYYKKMIIEIPKGFDHKARIGSRMTENKRFIIEPIIDVGVDANYKVKDTTDSWFFLTDSRTRAEFLCEKMNSLTEKEELLKEKVYRLERENKESNPDFSKDKINGDFEKIKLESDDLIKSFETISYFFKKIFDEWLEQKEVPLTRYGVEYNNVTLHKAYQIILDVKEVE